MRLDAGGDAHEGRDPLIEGALRRGADQRHLSAQRARRKLVLEDVGDRPGGEGAVASRVVDLQEPAEVGRHEQLPAEVEPVHVGAAAGPIVRGHGHDARRWNSQRRCDQHRVQRRKVSAPDPHGERRLPDGAVRVGQRVEEPERAGGGGDRRERRAEARVLLDPGARHRVRLLRSTGKPVAELGRGDPGRLDAADVLLHSGVLERAHFRHRLGDERQRHPGGGAPDCLGERLIRIEPGQLALQLVGVGSVLLDQRFQLPARIGEGPAAVLEAPLRDPVDRVAARLQLRPQRLQRALGSGHVRVGIPESLHGAPAARRRQRDFLEALAKPLGAGELRAEVLVGEAHVERDGGGALRVEPVDEPRQHPAVPRPPAELRDGRLVDCGDHHASGVAHLPALAEARVEQCTLQPAQERKRLPGAHFPEVQQREDETRGEADAERRQALHPASDPAHGGQLTSTRGLAANSTLSTTARRTTRRGTYPAPGPIDDGRVWGAHVRARTEMNVFE